MEINKERQAQDREMVLQWNQTYPVGTPITVTKDNGDQLRTITRSSAQMLGGHTPVIWVKGIAGCYSLERVMPRSQKDGKNEGNPT